MNWLTMWQCTLHSRDQNICKGDVPESVVAAERATLEVVTRNEGKPEQAIAKIVDGRVTGFFKDICLLEQPYAKDTSNQCRRSLVLPRFFVLRRLK